MKLPTAVTSARINKDIREDIIHLVTFDLKESYRKFCMKYQRMQDQAHKVLLSRLPKGFTTWADACPAPEYNHPYDTVVCFLDNDTVNANWWPCLREITNVTQRLETYHGKNNHFYSGDFKIEVPYTILTDYQGRPKFSLTLSDFPRLATHLEKCYEKLQVIEKAEEDLRKTLWAADTTKQLFEVWPEGYKYYKKYCVSQVKATKALISQDSLDNINASFKLP